jgi:hypothetical protein
MLCHAVYCLDDEDCREMECSGEKKMSNNNDLKKVLENLRPDAMQSLEIIKKANDTILMLSNQLKTAETRWTEMFVICATILNKYDREIRLTDDDMIALSPHDYAVLVEQDEKTDERIVRLTHITQTKGEPT